MPNRCIIIGSGASIRGLDWSTPTKKLYIWDLIKNEFTIGINWSKNFFISTIQLFSDFEFYISEKNSLEELPLVISGQDGYYGRETNTNWKKIFNYNNIYLLPSSGQYNGVDSWEKGFYSRKLSGLFALSLAIALGVEEVFLLGFDCCSTYKRTHFYEQDSSAGYKRINGRLETGIGFDSHGLYKTQHYNSDPNLLFKCFNESKVKIYNVSLNSKIDVFEKIGYEQLERIIKETPVCINQDQKREEFIKLHGKYYA